jgi:acetolactate synthase-1/2/3 large subunit
VNAQVTEVIAALNRAGRPMFMAGNGIRLAHAEREFLQAIDALEIPFETTWLLIDANGDDHPLFVGRPGSVAPRGANFAIQNCDFLLSVGARLDRVVTGFSPERFAPIAYKAMVDIDLPELAKMGDSVRTKICCDAGVFLRALLARKSEIRHVDRAEWKRRCATWKSKYPVVQPEYRKPVGPVSVYHLSDVLSDEFTADDYIVSGSSGSAIELFLLALRVKAGQRVFHTTALGSMGYGIAASIGVCMAGGRRRTVCVDGDGGFQFNIQELETVARLKLPIKFFVLNNDGYASIRASQINFFGSPQVGCDSRTGLTLPDLSKVAASYGLPAMRISSQAGLREQVRQALEAPGPMVCDVQVIPDEVRGPRLSSMQRPDGSMVSKPLEDLWPFLSRDEFLSNMVIPPVEE